MLDWDGTHRHVDLFTTVIYSWPSLGSSSNIESLLRFMADHRVGLCAFDERACDTSKRMVVRFTSR